MVGSYSRKSANRVIGQADLVCFVGSETGGMTTHFWAVPPIGTPAIQIDINAEALGRNYPLQACVNGDAKVTLAAMLEQADRNSTGKRDVWASEIRAICRDWAVKYKPALTSDAVPIRPERICHELTRNVVDDAIVVVDTGHGGMWMGGFFDLTLKGTEESRVGGKLSAPARKRLETWRWQGRSYVKQDP